MKKHLIRTALAAALMLSSATAVTLLATGPAMADEQKISHDVGKPLNDAIQAVQKGDLAAAKAALALADAVKDKTDFDSLKINQIKAYVAISGKDYATATAAYEAIVASPAFSTLDPKDQQQNLRNALLLSTNAQHWPQVISAAEQLEKTGPLDAVSNANLAVAYYNEKDMAKAKDAAQKAIDLDKAAGKNPEQPALQIVMSADAAANDQAGALAALEQLTFYYGGDGNWGELIDNGLGTKNITELDALYLYRLRSISHASTLGADYMISAGIAEKKGFPAEALQYLSEGYSSGKLTRSSESAALEAKSNKMAAEDRKALPQIVRSAEHAKDGKQELALAEDYWGYNRYADAVTAGKSALEKGVADKGDAHFIIGVSLAAQKQYADALQELSQVDGSPARTRAAQLWTLWVKREQMLAAPPAPAPATPAQPAKQ